MFSYGMRARGHIVNNLLQSPPSWIVAIVIAVLTAHAIDKLIEIVTRRRSQNGVIPILELFIALVIGFLAIHSYYEGSVARTNGEQWYDRPFALVIALVIFGFGSVGLYLVSRAQQIPKAGRRR